MARVVAMIPARLGSKRILKKNLRLLNGKPLIAYAIEAAIAARVFDDVYVNSEAAIFGEIAKKYGAKFYLRSEGLATDKTINDEFAYDFIQSVPGDILVQLLPTSPLITPPEINGFVGELLKSDLDTLISVEEHQIACVYNDQAVNFDFMEPHKSSQTMKPVKSYATVLMAWTYDSFKKNMRQFGFAYHGADGRTGYYALKGLSTIDIDNEDDFIMAEIAMKYREKMTESRRVYYGDQDIAKYHSETDVPTILKNDGVISSYFEKENLPLVNIRKIIESKDNSKSWCHRLINTTNNSATLISQLPGEGNRLHHHPEWNEWWYIVSGKWRWEIEGNAYQVGRGDVVFIKKNQWHKITAIGDKPAIRLAVSRGDVAHVYKKD